MPTPPRRGRCSRGLRGRRIINSVLRLPPHPAPPTIRLPALRPTGHPCPPIRPSTAASWGHPCPPIRPSTAASWGRAGWQAGRQSWPVPRRRRSAGAGAVDAARPPLTPRAAPSCQCLQHQCASAIGAAALCARRRAPSRASACVAMHPTQAHRAPFLPRRVPPAAAMGGSPPHPHLVQQGAGVWVGFLQEPTCNNHCLPAPCLLQRAAAAAPPTWGAPPPVGLRGARIMPPLCQAPRTRPWLLPVPVLPAHTPPPLLAHELACQRRRHGSPARASAPCRRRRRCRRRLKAAPLSCPALPLVSPCLPARLCPLPCPPALAPPAPPCPPTAPVGGLAACLAAAVLSLRPSVC